MFLPRLPLVSVSSLFVCLSRFAFLVDRFSVDGDLVSTPLLSFCCSLISLSWRSLNIDKVFATLRSCLGFSATHGLQMQSNCYLDPSVGLLPARLLSTRSVRVSTASSAQLVQVRTGSCSQTWRSAFRTLSFVRLSLRSLVCVFANSDLLESVSLHKYGTELDVSLLKLCSAFHCLLIAVFASIGDLDKLVLYWVWTLYIIKYWYFNVLLSLCFTDDWLQSTYLSCCLSEVLQARVLLIVWAIA